MTNSAQTVLSLPQAFTVVAHRPDGRRLSQSAAFDYGLVGAALTELATAGRIDVVDGKIVVRDSRPVDDHAASITLRTLAESRSTRSAKRWVRKLKSRSVNQACLDQLLERQAYTAESGRVLGLFPTTRYVLRAPDDRDALIVRMRTVAESGVPEKDTYATALLAVADASGLARKLLPGVHRKAIKAVIAGDWAAPAVRSAIAAANAAVNAAVFAAVSSSNSGSS
ncbi:GOLPH3/VPS74 family protein [Williamsia sterculiae]|uniref:Golgi phosphoprotein 3 (GPP34) n=1 Tax=Williamsia sterculiae TaxID=1344003 RepID=A0A1N7GS70_9NOCA|nr:GPP34 family phosphoprotein [Williamsia sterculiae]SIS15390.1 Golgi phosphoprotein 3 (GPP34) [Williamsia sterculiae]